MTGSTWRVITLGGKEECFPGFMSSSNGKGLHIDVSACYVGKFCKLSRITADWGESGLQQD
jgi:hypothetical protein